MTLADGQFRYRGLVIGKGTDYAVAAVDGLEGVPDVRVGDRNIPRGDGAVPGNHFLPGRVPILALSMSGPKADLLPPLQAAFKPARDTEHPLTFKRPGRVERRVWARVVSMPIEERGEDGPTLLRLRVGLRCADPRVYSEQERSLTVPLFDTSGGYADYPLDYPKDAASSGGTEAVASNDGDSDAYPLVRFWPSTGTTTRFRLQNRTNDSELDVTAAVVPGQVLTCRMREFVTGQHDVRIIDLSGASRYADWDSRPEPIRLSPGDNLLRFTAEGDTADVRCIVTWRHTWDGLAL